MTTPTHQLKALLHLGCDHRIYQTTKAVLKCERDFYFMQNDFIDPIRKLFKADKLSDVFSIILKAFSDGYSSHPKMIVAALSMCVNQSFKPIVPQQIREAAYKTAKIICSSPENFLLLLYLSAANGRGFQKFVKDWYLSKDAKTLGEIVGKNKRLFKISHKNIIRRSHLKPNGSAMAAVVKYLLFGIKTAKKEFEENIEANDVLNYLQTVEDFRHMKDEQQAARYIEMYNFTLEHVPPHLLNSKEVWNALIGNLPLPILLKNLQRIGNKGFLKPNSVLVNKVVDAINNETAIAESQIHPSHVYMELLNYECSSKFLAAEKAKRKLGGVRNMVNPKKGRTLLNQPNPEIILALYDLFATTLKMCLAPTGLRYFVAVDLKSVQPTDLCNGCLCVTTAQATVLTSLCLLHADRNVAIYIKNANEELIPLFLTNEMTIQEGIVMLEGVQMHKMQATTPIEWALNKKEEHDVFIIITDSDLKHTNVETTLQKYREEMKISNVKFIGVFLKKSGWVTPQDPGVFIITGFDRHVPRLIEAFSRGAF